MNNLELQALGNFVIVKPIEDELKSPSGRIFIPPIAQLKNIEGIVVSVGRGIVTSNGEIIPPEVSCGDRIIYDYRAANPIEINGEKFLFLPAESILAKKVNN